MNNLPMKLEVDVDGYGLYNKIITYGILCLQDKKYISTYSEIDFRKLINNNLGVLDNIANLAQNTLIEIQSQLSEGVQLNGKNMAIIMGMADEKYSICCLHKFKDQNSLFVEFEYIFKAVVKDFKDNLHTKTKLINPHK